MRASRCIFFLRVAWSGRAPEHLGDILANFEFAKTSGRFPRRFLAAWNGDLDLVGILLQYGADTEAKCRDLTPLEAACERGHARVAEFLAEASARNGGLSSIDPFLCLYPMKKKSHAEALGIEFVGETADEKQAKIDKLYERYTLTGSTRRDPDETATFVHASDQNVRASEHPADEPPKPPVEKFRWKAGFFGDKKAGIGGGDDKKAGIGGGDDDDKKAGIGGGGAGRRRTRGGVEVTNDPDRAAHPNLAGDFDLADRVARKLEKGYDRAGVDRDILAFVGNGVDAVAPVE